MIREADLHPERIAGPSQMPAVMDAAMFAIKNAPSVLVARVKCGKCGKSAGELIARSRLSAGHLGRLGPALTMTLESAKPRNLVWATPPTCTCPLVSCAAKDLKLALRLAKQKGAPVTFRLRAEHARDLTESELETLEFHQNRAAWREQMRSVASAQNLDCSESALDILEALRARGERDPLGAYQHLSARQGLELLRAHRGAQTD